MSGKKVAEATEARYKAPIVVLSSILQVSGMGEERRKNKRMTETLYAHELEVESMERTNKRATTTTMMLS
jgi:hypothetical protein